MILTYDFESRSPKNASLLRGKTIKNSDEFNKHFHSANTNIFMMDDMDDDLNEKKEDKSNNNNNNNNNNSNHNNNSNLM